MRVESFATTNGEIRIYSESAMEIAGDLGVKFEEAFDIGDAVIVHDNSME